jgi:hypothetical protein
MVGIAFSALVLMALVSIVFNFATRIRLMKHDTARDKLAWLSRGSSEVWDTYEALFPGSYVPRFQRFAFWTVIICAALLLVSAVLLKSR